MQFWELTGKSSGRNGSICWRKRVQSSRAMRSRSFRNVRKNVSGLRGLKRKRG
ncbi:hypothetical protein D3C75_1370490 [compost metagenome]